MQITKEFLVAEIQSLESEANKAQVFLIQAQATITAYKMLINKIDESERHGEQKIEISPFGTNAFSITTYLGSYLIQYTKQ